MFFNHFSLLHFRKENNILLNLKSESDLKRYNVRKNFPGRSFFAGIPYLPFFTLVFNCLIKFNLIQVFSRFHFLRVKSTTPEKYAGELRVSRNNFSYQL